jgi:hypothetical protein
MSPRQLPAAMQRTIWAEVVQGGLSARVLFGRHDLGPLGIKYDTFRKYVRTLQHKAPPARRPQGSSARLEAFARSLVVFLDVTFTPKAADGIVTELCRDRLGKVPGEAVGRRIPARSASLARRLDGFLSLAFERDVVDRLVRALCRWRFDGWSPESNDLLTALPANPAGWAESDTIPPDYISMKEARRRARNSSHYGGSRHKEAVRGWITRLAKRSTDGQYPLVKHHGQLHVHQSIHPALFSPVGHSAGRRVSAGEPT